MTIRTAAGAGTTSWLHPLCAYSKRVHLPVQTLLSSAEKLCNQFVQGPCGAGNKSDRSTSACADVRCAMCDVRCAMQCMQHVVCNIVESITIELPPDVAAVASHRHSCVARMALDLCITLATGGADAAGAQHEKQAATDHPNQPQTKRQVWCFAQRLGTAALHSSSAEPWQCSVQLSRQAPGRKSSGRGWQARKDLCAAAHRG